MDNANYQEEENELSRSLRNNDNNKAALLLKIRQEG